MKNKKANLPIVLLVIGVFGICSLALLTFLIADFKINNSFSSIGIMMEFNEDLEEYNFYMAKGVSENRLKQIYNLSEEGDELYFYREQLNGGALFKKEVQKGDLLFSVKYPVPS